MRRSALLLFAMLIAHPSPAFADGKRDLDDGIAFYENLDTERALERLKAATTAKDLSAGDRAKAFLYLGMVHFENGNKPDAESAWKKSFALDKNVAIPSGTSPKTIEAIEALRSAETAPPKPKDTEEPGGAHQAGSGETTPAIGVPPKGPAKDPGTAKPPEKSDKAETSNNPALTGATTGPAESGSSTGTWLLLGGIGAAVVGAAVVVLVLVTKGGDCKGGGGCLTVTFE